MFRVHQETAALRMAERRKNTMRLAIDIGVVGLSMAVAAPVAATAYAEHRVPGSAHSAAYHTAGRASSMESHLTRAMSKVLGKTTYVRCVDLPDPILGQVYLGSADLPFNNMELDSAVCDGIAAAHVGHPNADLPVSPAAALFVASHESAHLQYVERDENKTDCYALQEMPRVAAALGIPEEDGRAIQEYARSHTIAYGYPKSCTDGGPLDLHPEIPNPQDFPTPEYWRSLPR